MSAVIAITLFAGGAPVHVTVEQNSMTQTPFNISWALDDVLMPVAVIADSTGFNFSAPVGMPAVAKANAVASNSAGGGVGTLIVEVSVAPLTFTSP